MRAKSSKFVESQGLVHRPERVNRCTSLYDPLDTDLSPVPLKARWANWAKANWALILQRE